MAYETEENKDGGAFDDIVNAAKQNSSSGAAQGAPPEGVTDLKIILWANGFQVGDEGAFRNKDDPANQEFLAQLK